MRAAIREREPGAGDEIAHRARHEDLVRAGHCRDARGGVDRDAAQRALVALDLAGVHAGPRFEAELARRALDGARALHRFARTVEVGEQTVTRGVHLHAAVDRELAPSLRVVLREQLLPRSVADLVDPLRGAHEVDEEDRRQEPFARRGLDDLGDPLLDDPRELRPVLPQEMPFAFDRHKARTGNTRCEVARAVWREDWIGGLRDDESRHADRR